VNFRLLGDCLLWQVVLNLQTTLVHGKGYEFILAKNEFGYILGDFFTDTSGHPACMPGLDGFVPIKFPSTLGADFMAQNFGQKCFISPTLVCSLVHG
jgi:hypothetical protein